MVLLTALLSPAFFSCQKPAPASPGEQTPIQIYILRAKKATLSSLDLFFFHDDELESLDAYQRIEDPGEASVQGIAGSGAHRIVAFTNQDEDRYVWSDIRSFPALSSLSFSLEQDSPVAPFLYGQARVEAGNSRRCQLTLQPALAAIELRSLCCDFRGKGYEGALFHLERIFLTWANGLYLPLDPGAALSYLNPGRLDTSLSPRHTQLLQAETARDIGEHREEIGQTLYTYPNPAREASMGQMVTNLVLEGVLEGQRCYYPLPLPGVEANRHHIIQLTLTRMGSPDPDIPLEVGTLILENNTQPWTQAEEHTVRF